MEDRSDGCMDSQGDRHLETLREFLERTGSFNQSSLPAGCGMDTNPGLTRKVSAEGRLLGYHGNTVVYRLPDEAKRQIRILQDKLYAVCGDVLAEPLAEDTFHITLHDLVSGPASPDLERAVREVEPAAAARTAECSNEPGIIRMRSSFLFNMVNTSMVLGFEPEDEESCHRLMRNYEAFQDIVALNYPLTPHVTLAYFKPGTIRAEQVGRLQSVIDFARAREVIRVELSGSMLEYQIFSSMNCYRTQGQ